MRVVEATPPHALEAAAPCTTVWPNRAQVRYHAFNESEDSDTKLVDAVAVRRLRPLPPAAPSSFLRSLRAGVMVEMLYEDGWWVGQLLLVSNQVRRVHALPTTPGRVIGPTQA